MKTLKESLFSKKNLENSKVNKYGITEKDMKGDLKGFPVGVVVRMMEEQEKQRGRSDIGVFQKEVGVGECSGGFNWFGSEAGFSFWSDVIRNKKFNIFFEIYPEYEKYN